MKKVILLTVLAIFILTFSTIVLANDRGYKNPEMLISAQELKEELDNGKDIAVLDITSKINYTKGHIPGAVSLWGNDLTNPNDIKGMRLTAEAFASLMEAKGVSNDSHIVVYDHSGGLWAARVWWLLEFYNHTGEVQLLDGGIKTWTDAGYDLNHFGSNAEAGNYSVDKVNNELVISTEELKKKLEDPNFKIIDARSDAEYNGEKTFGGADRKGHIPGAVHIEWNNVLNENGIIKSATELKKIYTDKGITPDQEIAMHCHTAVRSAHTLFVLRLLGYPKLRNYDESWVGWSNNHSLPIE